MARHDLKMRFRVSQSRIFFGILWLRLFIRVYRLFGGAIDSERVDREIQRVARWTVRTMVAEC